MSRYLIAASFVLLWSAAASAQCTKDTECKGDRLCVRGECVDPPAAASAVPAAARTAAAPAPTAPPAAAQTAAAPEAAAPAAPSPSVEANGTAVAPAAASGPLAPAAAASGKLTAREIRERARAGRPATPAAEVSSTATSAPPPAPVQEPAQRPNPTKADSPDVASTPIAPGRLNALAFHPLPLIGGMILGAQNGVSMTLLLFEYTRSLTPNVSVYGRFGTMSAAVEGISIGGVVLGGGARLHLLGAGLGGPWAGGGFTTSTVGALTATTVSLLGGYTLEHGGFFFAPSVGLMVSPSTPQTPVVFAIEAPIGFAF